MFLKHISPNFLKNAAKELSKPLAMLFNKSLQAGFFPDQWKLANVVPVFKNGLKELVSNYRPIALLSIIGKSMERCIFKHFFNFSIRNNLITGVQSGFIPGDSTTNQLLHITNFFGKALDEGKEIRVVFCDISRAFDRVWHEGLIYKLEQIGVKGKLLKWFKSYLSNRKQKVVISGKSSEILSIKAGVPQGSILGPLLFLIYINDIVLDIACNIRLFADDTSLSIIVEDPYAAATLLNDDIEKIHNWSEKWLVNFNPRKTEIMTISRKTIKPHHPPVYMNNNLIKEVENHKHLGLIFDEDGSWCSHVNEIIIKVTPRLNLFRNLKFKLNRKQLQTIYFSFIRPILEYADIIWDNIPDYLSNQLENIQIEAARIVTGGTKLTSRASLYGETGWDTLSDRRRKHKIFKFHGMFHNKTPQYLTDIVPQQLLRVHNYNTRQANNIQNIPCRTTFYQNSFLPSVVRIWNNIPEEIRSNPSKPNLKRYLNQNLTKIPLYYNYGSRIAQVLHARLRMNSSSLNEYLFRKNLTDSNLCSCGEIESNKHFLLECRNYTLLRQRTIETLPYNYTLENLLFGNELLTDDENKNIFLQVQSFIVDSKRFGL